MFSEYPTLGDALAEVSDTPQFRSSRDTFGSTTISKTKGWTVTGGIEAGAAGMAPSLSADLDGEYSRSKTVSLTVVDFEIRSIRHTTANGTEWRLLLRSLRNGNFYSGDIKKRGNFKRKKKIESVERANVPITARHGFSLEFFSHL